MKKSHILTLAAVGLIGLSLAACSRGGDDKKSSEIKHSVGLVTDVGGVDDKSFNQSAWEGLQKWGKENDLSKGKGYDYAQSKQDSEYKQNISNLINKKYNTIFGIGYKLKDAILEASKQNEKTNFVLIDDKIEGQKNVASILFKDNEAAYLAGIAAAMTTKTNSIGFIGGVEGDVIGRFEAGYVQGARSVKKDIKIDIKYAAAFDAPAKGKTLAAAMYSNGADIIFQAAGGTGTGVFSEAKDQVKAGKKVFVIGVDRDQTDEGKYDKGNVTLTSTLKGVGKAVVDLSNDSKDDKFPEGKVLNYGLKEDGVDLAKGQLSDKVLDAVEKAKKEIVDNKITVETKPNLDLR